MVVVEPCANNVCQNGTCVPYPKNYRCICNKGITGRNCKQGCV